ncbi:MAG: lysophospholipase [Actinomycetia bacterium]|nr:lysophospholipase [Actinomycetes bacterium]
MKPETFNFKTDDGKIISAYKWLPADRNNIRGVVQIAHGMAEHASRYEDFAGTLAGSGYGVYANDHRGHGKTAGSPDNIGYFAPDNGWDLVVGDMHKLHSIITKDHPGLPIYLLGHSMGSLLIRSYIIRYEDKLSGVVLTGTSGDPGPLKYIGILIAKFEMKMKGKKAKSPMLDNLSFGSFNKAFAPNRTKFDWLSRDTSNVDKYVNDPFCGDIFSAGFFYDLLVGIKDINSFSNIENISKDLPILLLSGEDDPVGNKTRGVLQVYDLYKKAGIRDVNYKFYPGARHEILNEVNKEEVYRDIIEWLDSH